MLKVIIYACMSCILISEVTLVTLNFISNVPFAYEAVDGLLTVGALHLRHENNNYFSR